ncbi:MAG: hypothetical protein JWR37_1331 [Mycobacterium sp.]|nr:hypothetical protein [Mycobacterium sp.]
MLVPNGFAEFTLVSHDVGDGSEFDTPQLSDSGPAATTSHHTWWRGALTPTLSYVVAMFDELGLGDSGFWHWMSSTSRPA